MDKNKETTIKDIQRLEGSSLSVPLFSHKIEAGFPSPADEHLESMLDLNKYLIKHPAATFMVRASGNSMIGAGISDNDLLIVDRSLDAVNGKIVIAAINGMLTVKRIKIIDSQLYFVPENDDFAPIKINEEDGIYIWGVVTNVIRKL